MKILILNWRDIRSPRGGGAERVTHDVARRLVRRGHEVDWLSSAAPGLPARELIDGVQVHRAGTELTTRLHARSLARAVRPDVVLEEINTLPYLAPLWAKAPVVLYMNQLARNVWWYEAPRPLAAIGWAVEPAYLQAYRRCDAVTISESSRTDLRRFGVGRRIAIAPMATDVPIVEELSPRTLQGRLVAIGRLAPSKRYDHAISALAALRRTHPDATLELIGSGRSERALRAHAAGLGVEDAVHMRGNLDEAGKIEALDRADVLVGTSVREGWGLTVTEAAARGTPSVVYDIPGFRDAVVDGSTGLLTAPAPGALAQAVSGLLGDPELYDRLRTAARERVRAVTHEMTADVFESALRAAAGDG